MTNFIQLPNEFFEGENKLTPEELYVWSYLQSRVLRWEDKILISIDMASQELQLVKTKKINKQKLKEIIVLLHNKEVIRLNKEISENMKYDDLLKLDYINVGEEYTGFEKISFEYFNIVKTLEEKERAITFAILCYIKKNSYKEGKISYIEWIEFLNVSDKTVQNKLMEMANLGLINIEHGAYSVKEENKVRQEINKYHINSGSKQDDFAEYNQPKLKAEKRKQTQENRVIEEMTNVLFEEKEPLHSVEVEEEYPHNWFKIGSDLTSSDFDYYVRGNKEFKNKCEDRINKITKNGKNKKGVNFIDVNIKQAEERLQKEIVEKKRTQQKNEEIEERKKEQEQAKEILEQLKVKKLAVKRNEEIVYLDSINQLQINDYLLLVQEISDFDNITNEHILYHTIKEIAIKTELLKIDYEMNSREYVDSGVVEQLFNIYKLVDGDKDKYIQQKQELFNQLNKNKSHDTNWNRDIIYTSFGGGIVDKTNKTQRERVRKYNKEQKELQEKQEQENKRLQENNTFLNELEEKEQEEIEEMFNWGGEDPIAFNEFDENESAEYKELQMQINYM